MRTGAWIAACSVGSLLLFLGCVYARLHLAYGPFNLSLAPADWMVLWDLYRTGQIERRIVAEGAAAGLLAAGVPWLAYAFRRA